LANQHYQNKVESKRFMNNYEYFLDEIRQVVVEPELFPILEELRQTDLNELFCSDPEFLGSGDMRGFVWSLFVEKALYNSNFHQP